MSIYPSRQLKNSKSLELFSSDSKQCVHRTWKVLVPNCVLAKYLKVTGLWGKKRHMEIHGYLNYRYYATNVIIIFYIAFYLFLRNQSILFRLKSKSLWISAPWSQYHLQFEKIIKKKKRVTNKCLSGGRYSTLYAKTNPKKWKAQILGPFSFPTLLLITQHRAVF